MKDHPFFAREGNDLHCVVPISIPQAAVGAEIRVPTMEGEHTLQIPEGTQPNTTFRIRNNAVYRNRRVDAKCLRDTDARRAAASRQTCGPERQGRSPDGKWLAYIAIGARARCESCPRMVAQSVTGHGPR